MSYDIDCRRFFDTKTIMKVEANAEISAEVELSDVPYTQKHFI
jgi:hypothetical protein